MRLSSLMDRRGPARLTPWCFTSYVLLFHNEAVAMPVLVLVHVLVFVLVLVLVLVLIFVLVSVLVLVSMS
jgi:hypothetical protein